MTHRSGLAPAMIAVAFLAALQGCGFEPMLATQQGNNPAPTTEIASVKVASIAGRSGQVLRNDLVNALTPHGEPDHPQYTLVITLEEPQQNLAFQRNNSVSFVAASVNARWSLLDNKTGAVVFAGGSSSSSRYVISNSPYATVTSADNTRDLNVQDISTDIRAKLAQYFFSKPPSDSRSQTK